MFQNFNLKLVRFCNEEVGLSLTEYLLLLGLLTAAVIIPITLLGTNLASVWDSWTDWISIGLQPPV